MAVETKNGWIFAVRQLDQAITSGSGVPAATETTNGTVKAANFVAVPATFADLAAVKTYLDAVHASMVAAGQMSAS
jgi:hypothetical protein